MYLADNEGRYIMTKILYLMRHGQTLFNARGKIQGACDSPLTELGIQQAQHAARFFDTITIDQAYSSTSERASDTLELVTRNAMEYKRLKGIKEFDHGTFEGESEDLNPRTREGYETFYLPYGGESSAMVRERMMQTLTDIMEESSNTVLVVSHGGAIMNFLIQLEGTQDVTEGGKIGNCAILKLEYKDKEFTFKELINLEDIE